MNLWSILPLFDLFRYPFEVSRDARALAGYGVYALQFFDPSVSSPVGEALGPSSITGEMPYTIGILLLAGSLLFAALCFRKNQKLPDWHKKLGSWCLALGLLSCLCLQHLFPLGGHSENRAVQPGRGRDSVRLPLPALCHFVPLRHLRHRGLRLLYGPRLQEAALPGLRLLSDLDLRPVLWRIFQRLPKAWWTGIRRWIMSTTRTTCTWSQTTLPTTATGPSLPRTSLQRL